MTLNSYEKYNLTLDYDGGVATNRTTYSKYTPTFTLNNPIKEGYEFVGWNGKNLLDYTNITSIATEFGILCDEDGFISDTTPQSDGRGWTFAYSSWIVTLNPGTYTLSLYFSKKHVYGSSTDSSSYEIIDNNGNIFKTAKSGELYNIDKISATFTVIENVTIGIIVKAYDGVYKMQLEEGSTSTDWEPYTQNIITIEKGSTGDKNYKAIYKEK